MIGTEDVMLEFARASQNLINLRIYLIDLRI